MKSDANLSPTQAVDPSLFCDLHEPLTPRQALTESSRCYYCYDAPCVQACPTHIDIPSFIRKISNGNIKGAAIDILDANIFGGTCARACPVEVLCQSACVREKAEAKPVEIGLLQRYAVDEYLKQGNNHFKRLPENGQKVAVVGAGPAGLSCAHRLSTLGYSVTVFESKEKAGGLNEYGLAPYKLANQFAQREIDFILSIGGIRIQNGMTFGESVTLEQLQQDYSAVFVGVGLTGNRDLGIPGEFLNGCFYATDFIEKIRKSSNPTDLPTIGRNVIVIGGGNTAVDIAIQAKMLGAENVTIAYRRGQKQMGATLFEQELAQKNGVVINTWIQPIEIRSELNHVSSIEFEHTELDEAGKLKGTGQRRIFQTDQIFKATGQKLKLNGLRTKNGKIEVSSEFETSIPGVFAGGDCVEIGDDLTVTAVQHGKLAALSIHKKLEGKANG